MKCLLKNRSCPAKPWSFQIQYFITDLEPRAWRLNGQRWLIHAMKSMFRSVSVRVISLASARRSISLSGRPRGKPAAAVNRCYRAAGRSRLAWLVGTKEGCIRWLTARWAVTRQEWGSVDIFLMKIWACVSVPLSFLMGWTEWMKMMLLLSVIRWK